MEAQLEFRVSSPTLTKSNSGFRSQGLHGGGFTRVAPWINYNTKRLASWSKLLHLSLGPPMLEYMFWHVSMHIERNFRHADGQNVSICSGSASSCKARLAKQLWSHAKFSFPSCYPCPKLFIAFVQIKILIYIPRLCIYMETRCEKALTTSLRQRLLGNVSSATSLR